MLPLIQSAYFQTLINGFPDGVIIFNIAGDAYVANATAQDLLGMDEAAILSSRWDTIFQALPNHDEFVAYMESAAERTDATRRASMHAEWVRPDGTRLHLSCVTSLIIEYDKIFGILLAITDVTHIFEMHDRERKMLEEKRVLERERARGLQHFSMAVAHQIRNPVMAIGGFARMLLRKAEEGTNQHELLTAILESGIRLDEIVKVVSDYNTLHLSEKKHFLVCDCIQAARTQALGCFKVMDHCETLAPEGENFNAPAFVRDIVWIMDLDSCTIRGDKGLLQIALAEVLRNSLEALERGHEEADSPVQPPSIRIECLQDGERCQLRITDSGKGVAPEHMPYLFDPFFTTKSVGVGMGLTKVQRIVREHKGEVVLTNLADGGVQVCITLPAVQDEAPKEPAA